MQLSLGYFEAFRLAQQQLTEIKIILHLFESHSHNSAMYRQQTRGIADLHAVGTYFLHVEAHFLKSCPSEEGWGQQVDDGTAVQDKYDKQYGWDKEDYNCKTAPSAAAFMFTLWG